MNKLDGTALFVGWLIMVLGGIWAAAWLSVKLADGVIYCFKAWELIAEFLWNRENYRKWKRERGGLAEAHAACHGFGCMMDSLPSRIEKLRENITYQASRRDDADRKRREAQERSRCLTAQICYAIVQGTGPAWTDTEKLREMLRVLAEILEEDEPLKMQAFQAVKRLEPVTDAN